jgi:hypothetical protein
MTTADWALVISLLSFVVSFGGFIWNVWSKFIYPKPKVHVTCAFVHIVSDDKIDDAISLTAVNHGPIQVTLGKAMLFKRGFVTRKKGYGVLFPLHNYPVVKDVTVGPFGGGLPKKLEVGEQFSVNFAPGHPAIAADEWSYIGFDDTFGRTHWASRRDLRETRKHVREFIAKFGAAEA